MACVWSPGPERPLLPPTEVQVWCADLRLNAHRLETLAGLLSERERTAAQRFRFEADRARFVASHGLLRDILARYLRAAPATLAFGRGLYGKPELADSPGNSPLRFNLSHSGDVALLAVALGREVGVDVERVARFSEVDDISEQWLSAEMASAVRRLESPRKEEAFCAFWTRREAVLKAAGVGFTGPSPQLGMGPTDLEESPGWQVLDLAPAAGYVGAVAGQGSGWVARCWGVL